MLTDAYAEVAPRLRRWGARLSVEGEDVAQDACVRLLGREHPNAVTAPAAFLLRVARNLFVDRQRARARDRSLLGHSEALATQQGETADPERILAGKQRLEAALAAIRELPPRCREAFLLHRFDGLSYGVIAERMGVSASMVEKHIARAMSRLDHAMRAADGPGPV